jgi:tetratricopeptide (TPR) repeat protein
VVDGLSQRSAAVLIVGLGGNGKTSLAREVAAHCLQDEGDAPRFDAVVWVNDQEHPGTTNQSNVFDTIARTLNYSGLMQFPHDEKQYEVEQLLRRQQVLLIIDNAETITDSALFTWLLRLPEPSKTIITSRERNRALWSSWLVELRGMNSEEACTLLSQRLKRLSIQLTPDVGQVELLVEATGGNPKAITIVAGLLKHRPFPQIMADLHAVRGDLSALLNDLFRRSWALLDEAGKCILLVMTFFPDSASVEALSATADVIGFEFDRATEQLTDLSLLDVQQTDLASTPRYVLHPLVRAFVGSQLAGQSTFEQAARGRWVDWYVELSSQVGYCAQNMENLRLLDPETGNILSVIEWTFKNRRYSETISIAAGSSYYYCVRGFWDKQNVLEQIRSEAARYQGDIVDELFALSYRSHRLCERGLIEDVESILPRLREIANSSALPNDALFEYYMVFVSYYRACDEVDKALEAIERIVELPDLSPQRYSLGHYQLAYCWYLQKEFRQAQHLFEEFLHDNIVQRNQSVVAALKLRLAQIDIALGNLDTAVEKLAVAHAHACHHQEQPLLAEIQYAYGCLHVLQGELPEAHAAFLESIDLFERLGMRRELAEAREELARLEAQMAEAAE